MSVKKTLVAGNHQTRPFVAVDYQAEEQAGFDMGKRQVTDLVDDENFGIAQLPQAAVQTILMQRLVKRVIRFSRVRKSAE